MLVTPALLLSGCKVKIDNPEVSADDEATCRSFLADLPASLAGENAREVKPDDALGAAYGDPAITVTCGVPVPDDFTNASSCEVANGVGWYVPPDQFDDQSADVTLTAAGYRPVVEIKVPGEYRPDGPAGAIAQLAAPVKAHLELVQACS